MAELAHFIVPTTAHDAEMLDDCLEGLACQRNSRIVLVVNTEEDSGAACEICRSLIQRGTYVTLVDVPEQIGYTRACNIGLAAANAAPQDTIVVLNDDTVTSGDLVTPIVAALAGGRQLVGPSVKHVGRDGFWGQGHEPYLFVEGWCLAARLETLNLVGGLYDDKFHPGYCEDMDLAIRVQHLGGRVGQIALPIKHLRSQTYGNDRPWWTRNREYLVQKHNLA